MNLWDLPTSVFEGRVLSSLSVRDLASLGQVSRQFRDEVQSESVWEAMYHHHYGPRSILLKRAAEIAGGYRQLCRSRLLSDKASGPGIYRATEAEEAAFVESVIGSGGWTVGSEGSGEAQEGPAGILFLVDTSLSLTAEDNLFHTLNFMAKIVSAAINNKSPACLTGASQFQLQAQTLLPLQLRTAQEFESDLSPYISEPQYTGYDSVLGCGAHLAPAMALVREEFGRANLPLSAPKCVVVVSDGLGSPDEVAEAQAAAAELCRGDLGPVRVFGVGFGKAARMDEFRGMLEAQGSLPPQASARYLTLMSDNKPLSVTEDLKDVEDHSFITLSDVQAWVGVELDDYAPGDSPGAIWGPPAAWLAAKLPPHKLQLSLTIQFPRQNERPGIFDHVLTLAPWVESLRVTIRYEGGTYTTLESMLLPLPYSQQELGSFSNLRKLALDSPDSIPFIPSLESLEIGGMLRVLDFSSHGQFEALTNLRELKIAPCELLEQKFENDFYQRIYGALTAFPQLERLSLGLPGPIRTLPDLSFCKRTLKSFSFTFMDSDPTPGVRYWVRKDWHAEYKNTSDMHMITVSDLFIAVSDCASLDSLEFEVMSPKCLEGIELLAGLPSLKRLTLVCSLLSTEMEEGQAQFLAAFSALEQVETIVLCESPNAETSVWRCDYSWEEGTLKVKTESRPE